MKILIATLMMSFTAMAQIEITPDVIKGEWTSKGKGLDLTITTTQDYSVKIKARSSTSKKNVTVLDVLLRRYTLTVDTLFEPNQWATQSRFVMINEDTMVSIVTGDAEGEIVYFRVK